MKLTSEAVQEIVKHCLFKEGEDASKHVNAEAVMMRVGFHPERLAEKRGAIADLLAELPDQFRKDGEGGWSFLNACCDRHGNQWGEHRNIDELLALGIASKQAKILFPREMWSVLPGGMPYFAVGDFSSED